MLITDVKAKIMNLRAARILILLSVRNSFVNVILICRYLSRQLTK